MTPTQLAAFAFEHDAPTLKPARFQIQWIPYIGNFVSVHQDTSICCLAMETDQRAFERS